MILEQGWCNVWARHDTGRCTAVFSVHKNGPLFGARYEHCRKQTNLHTTPHAYLVSTRGPGLELARGVCTMLCSRPSARPWALGLSANRCTRTPLLFIPYDRFVSKAE